MTWAYGSYKMKNSILMIDWTRTLRNFFYKKKIKKDIAYILQSHILKKIPRINCLLNLENCDRIYDGSYVVPMLDNNNNSSLMFIIIVNERWRFPHFIKFCCS